MARHEIIITPYDFGAHLGEELIGRLVRKEEIEMRTGKNWIYEVDGGGGEIRSFWGTLRLNELMRHVTVGQFVYVVPLGKKTNAAGNEEWQFTVSIED